MKKLLLFVVLMFCTLSYSATKEVAPKTETPVLDKTEQLVDKYGAKMVDAFSSTIEKTKPMAKEAFETVIMLQIAKGIANLLPLLFFIIFLYLFKKEYDRIQNILISDNVPENMSSRRGVFDDCNLTPFIIIYLIFLIVCFIVAMITTYDGITYLLAPKWFAIKEIIGLFK